MFGDICRGPGCMCARNGVPRARDLYDAAQTSMTTYPFSPPLSKYSTEQEFAFIQRSSWWTLTNVDSPRILGSILCLKKSAFKSVLDAMAQESLVSLRFLCDGFDEPCYI